MRRRIFGVRSWRVMAAGMTVLALTGAGCSNGDSNPVVPQHELIDLTLVAGQAAALNHWPGADGLVATGDDPISASLSSLQASATNSESSYSYNAFDFGGGATDPFLPSGMNAVTFLSGTLTVDHTVLDEGGGAVISALSVSGTEPLPGHGAYTATFTNVRAGTYDPATHAFTLDLDFTASLTGGTANAVNFTLSGTARILHTADFGDVTGDAYLDNVVIPLAQSLGATSVFFAEGSGTVPASTGGSGGSFPSMPVKAVLVAYTTTTP